MTKSFLLRVALSTAVLASGASAQNHETHSRPGATVEHSAGQAQQHQGAAHRAPSPQQPGHSAGNGYDHQRLSPVAQHSNGNGRYGSPPKHFTRGQATWNTHAQRCATRYRSYNPRTDTFVPRAGRTQRCFL
jgi:hypothetical protein